MADSNAMGSGRADIIHEVHDADTNTTTLTIRDTSSADPVREASSEVMKARKISKPKGKSTARPAMTSAIPASMDSVANANQGTGLQFPTVPPTAHSTLPALSNASESRDPAATPSLAKPATPAKPSRLAARMEQQQHEPSRLGSLLNDIAQPTATTYTVEGPSTKLGSLRNEINQPLVPTYSPQPLTPQSPPMEQDQPSRNGSRPDEIDQPTAATYSSHPPASQLPPMQQDQPSRNGTPPDEISKPTATPYSPTPPTSQSHPKQVESTSSDLVISSASITENQDVTPVLPSTAGVIRQNAPLVVPQVQPFQLPTSPLVTPPLSLAASASVNSKIPLFHPSMLPNSNKHFTTTQNPASGSYGYSSQISTERSVASFSTHTSPLFGQALQPAIPYALPSARPSMSDVLRNSPTNPHWKPATHAFIPSVPHTPWPLQTTMDHDEGELLQAPDTIPSLSVDPEHTITADSDEMEDLKPAVAAIIPQPVYRPTVNIEMECLKPEVTSVVTEPLDRPTMNQEMADMESEVSSVIAGLVQNPIMNNEMEDLKPEVTSVVAGPVQNPITNNEMEDLKPEITSVVPEPMYRPTVDNELELDDLDAVSESAQSPSTLQYNQKEQVLTYNADSTPHTPPVAASQLEDIASTEVEPKEEVSDITKDEPSNSEEAGDAPECSDTFQNIEIKQCDLDPKYFEYRNKEARKSRPFHWDLEDNRDPRSEYDCTDEETKEIITKLAQLKLRVTEYPTTALNNESRVTECSGTTLDEIRVAESPTTALKNEPRVVESATQVPDKDTRVIECPTAALNNEVQVTGYPDIVLGNENLVIDSSTKVLGNESRADDCSTTGLNNWSRIIGCSTTTSNNEIVQSQMRPNEEKVMSDLHAAFMKEHRRAEELDKKLKEAESKRISIWRRSVDEAAAKRTEPFEIATAEKLAKLDHKESSLRDERKQFEADCVEREEELKSREQKLASNELDYARRLRDLQTREARLNDSTNLTPASSSSSSTTPSMFINDRNIELEHTWSMFADARMLEDPQQIEQNSMFSSSWNIEEPQQIEQDSMFLNTWNIEERVIDIPGTGSHSKWMLPLLLVLALLSSTVLKLLQQPLSPGQDVTAQHFPDTCSSTERPVTISSSISPPDLLCLADYSNNYSEVSSFPLPGLIDLANDSQPLGERVVGIGSVSHTKTSSSTLAVFKTWFWNFVLTGTAHGRVGVEAGRRELYH